ncbi:PAS domain S-box protein [Waterburya agarophytonicola K14]|uniref:histidine kinase n=2 Tax=Waterburya TaxID=2886915 RepID=A0A964BV96_9CYAN|nr:PAS domain S-box protein [Waterburya agarophytonicola KI4]
MTERSPNLDPTANNSPTKKLRTVMLIDDSEVDRAVYRRYLQTDAEYQYTFVEAETGEEALELYAQCQPDIILLDYLLPDFDGLEWLVQWQRQYKNFCSLIVLTGQGDENIAVQFIKNGAADYFVKDRITPEKLKLAIGKEIALKKLQLEKQDLFAKLISRNEKLERSNRLYQAEIAQRDKLSKIIANVPVVIYAKYVDATSKQPGKLWLVNQEFQQIFKIAEAEAIGKTDRELFPPHIADDFAANDRLLIASKQPITTEEEVYHADGTLHTYLSFKFPLFSEGEITSIVGMATDITPEKQAQTELLQSETRFRQTFEQAAVGIAHVAPDGKWLRVNQKLCQIVGYTKEELLSITFQDITHPEDLHTDLEYVRQILAGAISTYSMEKRYIRKDEAYIWINLTVSLVSDSNDEPDYFIAVIEDISDRKALEASLQKSWQRLSNLHQIDKAILAAVKPQAIAETVIKDIQNLLTCQRASIVTFDWERETSTILATQGVKDDVLNNGLQVSLDIWQGIIDRLENEDKQGYITAHLSQLPKSSEMAIALENTKLDCFFAFPLNSQDNLLGILKLWFEEPETITTEELTMLEEISSQLAIALEQARLYKQTQNYALELEAKVAQRTAQIEEINQELKAFTYTISHDLKAPLRAIQGFASALQEDYGDNLDDLGQEYAARLISSAWQMTQLIEDLLAYSRLCRIEIQLKSVDLEVIVHRAIEQLQLEIERTQANIILVEPLSSMIGNKTILLQIVSNLLSNAIKFVPPKVQPQIRIGTEIIMDSAETKIRLWVEDNGIGIDREHQKRIFQVFERLHGNEAYPGTGIGLAIVKKSMERLGGRFGVESNPGKGSRFWIEGRQR